MHSPPHQDIFPQGNVKVVRIGANVFDLSTGAIERCSVERDYMEFSGAGGLLIKTITKVLV